MSAADTSMPQISVAYTSMTRVSSFENGRNQMIISFASFAQGHHLVPLKRQSNMLHFLCFLLLFGQ